MSLKAAPDWLEDFQRRFTSVLRTPLDSSSKVFQADAARYDVSLCAEVEMRSGRAPSSSLAVYNRQYWFRLFGVLQNEYPLTARLMGYWTFNHYAQRFLVATPPQDMDVARAADGFSAFVAREAEDKPAWVSAARMDAAWIEIFRAAEEDAWRPDAAAAARLAEMTLIPRKTWAIVNEEWPLLALRETILGDAGEHAIALPPRLSSPQWWCLARVDGKFFQLPMGASQARLYSLLRQWPLAKALAVLEQETAEDARAHLLQHVQSWLARSMEWAFWKGAIIPGP